MQFQHHTPNGWEELERPLPDETPLTITVEQKEWVTLYCTPVKLNCLVVGFLYLSGVIDSVIDLKLIRVCADDTFAEVALERPERLHHVLSRKAELTSGCGTGVSFSTLNGLARVDSDVKVAPAEILDAVGELYAGAQFYRASGGLHACGLWQNGQMLAMNEDIGRHNAVDKVAGECLLRDIPIKNGWLVTTGRLSSEMVLKAARMQTPIVISRTSPTTLAARLAEDLGITLIGYVRGSRFNVYTNHPRVSAGLPA